MDPVAQRKFHNILLSVVFFVLGASVWVALSRPTVGDVRRFVQSLLPGPSESTRLADLRAALRFSYPPDTVVFARSAHTPSSEFVPVPESLGLIGGAAVARRPPQCWNRLIEHTHDRHLEPFTAVPFLHSMTTHGGRQYLVAVELLVRGDPAAGPLPTGEVFATAYSYRLPTATDASAKLEPVDMDIAGPLRCVRVYAGQSVPLTPGRLQVAYEFEDSASHRRDGRLVGEVNDDGSIHLTMATLK